MQAVTQQITRIQSKLQELAKKHVAALKENEQQHKSFALLQKQQELSEKKIKLLEEQQHILKASAGKMAEPDKKKFEQVIAKYIREIDKCIDLLSE